MNRRTFLMRGMATLGLTRLNLAAATAEVGGFTPLCNGFDLDGWHRAPFAADHNYGGARWSVRDGAIHGERFPSGDSRGGVLLTDASFSDFELELDLWPDWGCDSGVFLRCTQLGAAIQVKVDYLEDGDVGFIHGQGTGGFLTAPIKLKARAGGGVKAIDVYDAVKTDGLLYAATAGQWRAAWRLDDWNRLRIRCAGKHPRITTWINDARICDMDSATFRARHRLDVEAGNWEAPPAFDREKLFAQLGPAGHVGLQVHPGERWTRGGVVRYRNIRIRRLDHP